MICAAECAKSRLPLRLGYGVLLEDSLCVGKIKTVDNITRKESMAMKFVKDNKEIRFLQADIGDCTVVLNEFTYKEKMFSLLKSGVYEILHKDPISQIEQKIRKLLTNDKTVLPVALKCKLTPYLP
jgi:hypothetical protein